MEKWPYPIAAEFFARHPAPTWLQDARGRIRAVNRAAIRHYGIQEEQFLRLRHADLLALPGPADAACTLSPIDGDVVTHHVAEGKRALMQLSISPCPIGGAEYLLVMAADVTRQRSESQLLRETVAEVQRLQELEWHGRRAAELAQMGLQALSRGLIELQERERRGIARELHDEIGQSLSAIRVQFAKLRRRVDSTELLDLIDAASLVTEQTLGRVRTLSLMLHPPQLETLGLEAALRWHIRQLSKLHGMDIAFETGPLPQPLRPDVAIAVYRIVQEALNNVVLHARASHAGVELAAHEKGVRVVIRDDGAGFCLTSVKLRWEESPSLGLLGMQERARQLGGELEVWSQPGVGTRIEAFLPEK